MPVVKVSVYKTSDGKTFDDMAKAKRHEVDLETTQELRSILSNSLSTGRSESVLLELLYSNDKIRPILTKYSRRQKAIKT